MSIKHEDNNDRCNGALRNFVVQWSPRNDTRYLSGNMYTVPRQLSKSVPRRNRRLVRYGINRSLNFDIGAHSGEDRLMSPNSSSDSSSLSMENDHYLSRSAKILRALNIDYASPLKSGNPCRVSRKINKSLNFDDSSISQSPKSLHILNKCSPDTGSLNKLATSSKISKTLNFESSSESSVNSRLDSSIESTDENQNQTPSQRYGKAKKSLSYPSPKFTVKSINTSGNISARSPLLRTNLREKIDTIRNQHRNSTPNFNYSRRSFGKSKSDSFSSSTPRNLFNDFEDTNDDDDKTEKNENNEDGVVVASCRDNNGPRTPKNFIKILPGSMNAIKKSHKKERVLGRAARDIAYDKKEISPDSECFDEDGALPSIDTARKNKDAVIPSFDNVHHCNSPYLNIDSINRYRNKYKSEKSCYSENSDDGMSETGSIFDYSEKEQPIVESSSSMRIDDEKNVYDAERQNFVSSNEKNANEALECKTVVQSTLMKESAGIDVDLEEHTVDEKRTRSSSIDDASSSNTGDNKTVEVEATPTNFSNNASTPENRINFLQRIMTDSIKKSHKKMKDAKRKLLSKPRMMESDEEDEEEKGKDADKEETHERKSEMDVDRAVTPENTNSSRLLLSQFSSVKKSHKKDKHRKMLSGSLERKKFFARQEGETISNSDSECNDDCSFESCNSEFQSFVDTEKESNNVEKLTKKCSLHHDFHPRSNDKYDLGIEALTKFDLPKSSPNKRKNVSDESVSEVPSLHVQSISTSFESAEEEFNIFTPIKKRRSVPLAPRSALQSDHKEDSMVTKINVETCSREEESEEPIARCSTPTSARRSSLDYLTDRNMTIGAQKNVNGRKSRKSKKRRNVVSESQEEVPMNPEPTSNDGRATPQNQSSVDLIPRIDSIKKSHKKDKRANYARSFFRMSDQGDQFQSNVDDPPSSSRSRTDEGEHFEIAGKETTERATTPPNCLQAKNYLRLIQSESIKRSHKKVRDRKKRRATLLPHQPDSPFSDDAQILNDPFESTSTIKSGVSQHPGDNAITVTQERLFRPNVSPVANFDRSNEDGSIFGDEEEEKEECLGERF